jgi:hypothetical protein
MVNPLVFAGSVQQQGIGVVLGLLVQPYARLASGQLGDEVRGFQRKEGKNAPFPLIEAYVWPHGGDRHFHGPVERVLVETGGLMSSAADDYWVNGGATTPTSAVDATMSLGTGHQEPGNDHAQPAA